MATIFAIIVFVQNNLSFILQIQQGACFALSSLFQLLKMPKTSKFFGTFGVDGGRLIRWVGGLGITSKPKSWLELVAKMAGKLKASAALLVIALGVSVCVPRQPAEAPTPIEIATAAVNLTDEALVIAVETNPNADWLPSVIAVEKTMWAIRSKGDICDTLPALQLVASRTGCEKCLTLVAAAKESLSCPQ